LFGLVRDAVVTPFIVKGLKEQNRGEAIAAQKVDSGIVAGPGTVQNEIIALQAEIMSVV